LQSFRTPHPKLIIMSEIDRSEEKGVLTREADVDFSVHVFPLGGRAVSGYEFLKRRGILGDSPRPRPARLGLPRQERPTARPSAETDQSTGSMLSTRQAPTTPPANTVYGTRSR
jgi:hypothetical protein